LRTSFIHLDPLPSSFNTSFLFSSVSRIHSHSFHQCSIAFLPSPHILHLRSTGFIQKLFSRSSFPHLNLAINFLSFVFCPSTYFVSSFVIIRLYAVLHLDFVI